IAFFITYKFYYYLPIERKLKSILKIPMINTYYKIYRTYQLSNQLSLFYRNGTSLQQIVQIYRNEQDNEFLKFLGNCLFKEANRGLPLPTILMNLQCFQNDLIKFIEQGEKNGKLDIELKLYSQMLLQQFEEKVLKQTKFIQPIIFFILGIFIVSLYLVIMLPMFELMQTIK
ncbi:type II secretion system F family protein, partial [Staphylococcus epidermidis]